MSDVDWQKSMFSSGDLNTNCVEVSSIEDAIRIRESDRPDVALTVTTRSAGALLARVKRDGVALRALMRP